MSQEINAMDDKKWLKEAIDKLDAKVDKLDQRLDDMRILDIENASQLKEHILRTELNEENIAMLREDFKPIQKHDFMVAGGLKLIGTVALVAGIIEGGVKVIEFFIK